MARLFTAASSQKIDWGDIAEIDGVANLTVSSWIYLVTLTDFAAILSKTTPTATSGWTFQSGGTGFGGSNDVLISARDSTGGQFGYTSGNIIAANTWNHWCYWFDGAGVGSAGRLKFYFNGVEQGLTYPVAIGTTIASNAQPFEMGFTTGGVDPYYDGRIAECGIWNVSLSISEIVALARGVRPNRLRPASLQFYAPLWGLHSPEVDLSTFRRSGTVTGATLANHAPVTTFTTKAYSFPAQGVAAANILMPQICM